MLTVSYANTNDAEAAKAEFGDLLPDYTVENIPDDNTLG